MLHSDFDGSAMKWPIATEPFADDHCQRVLVALGSRPALDLLRGYVGQGPSHTLGCEGVGTVSDGGDAEVR